MSEELEQASENLVETAKANRAAARGPFGRMILFFQQVIAEIGRAHV